MIVTPMPVLSLPCRPDPSRFPGRQLLIAVVGCCLLGVACAGADELSTVIEVGQARSTEGRESQQRIDAIASETDKQFREYRQVLKEVEGLRVYNNRLQRQIDNQLQRLGNIERAIAEVAVIQRQMIPLMVRMVGSLESFVELDYPFHIEERRRRIAFLRENLDRSDLSTAEKFRQVLEAYKIENEYGRKIDSYTDTVDGREVNVLRVGRIALLAQTTDTERAWVWDQEDRAWAEINANEYRSILSHGLRMANDQDVIKLLRLPIPAPGSV